MKGLAIHVEQLIIIIIVVLVLLAVITFFLGVWNPKMIIYRGHLTRACTVLQNLGCATEYIEPNCADCWSGVKANEVGRSGENELKVSDVCTAVLGPGTTVNQCLKACACLTQ